ncbi:hypothetical protein [Gimesia fumaroli]|uniref:Uncharacterized protein n=1 Tax=Gimesia fumaroli TaxID=2527976 RepID=A0A518I876_9PLAN|nr:hypothetical protein [Gimesia fumaroli]QDV49295.1 hypothetical protein Enr17x_13120 [Gimesia fumaroli]
MQAFATCLLIIAFFSTSLSITSAQEPPQIEPILIQSQGLIFVVPQSRDKLMAYSTVTNSWSHTEIAIEESSIPLLKIQPTVGNTLAACQLGQELHAYSAKTGLWAKLRLPLPHESKISYSISDNLITAYVKTKTKTWIYVFGEDAKAWSGVNLTTGEQAPTEEKKQ